MPTGRKRVEVGVDYLEAAESRIRQLQTHSATLERQVRRLKDRLEAVEAEQGDMVSGRGRSR